MSTSLSSDATEVGAWSNLSVTEAAQRLGISVAFLNKLRSIGGGPAFVKLGSRVVYQLSDLQAWQESRKRRSTAPDGKAA